MPDVSFPTPDATRRSRRLLAPLLAGAVSATGLTLVGQGSALAAPMTPTPPASAAAVTELQLAAVRAAALQPSAAVSRISLHYGSRGNRVKAVQRRLGVRPVSGWYGPITTRAVKRFQRSAGLLATGRIGPRTWTALHIRSTVRSSRSTIRSSSSSYSYSLGPVRSHVRSAAYAIGPRFGIRRIGGWRPGAAGYSGHPSGLALDFMSSYAQGNALASYVRSNAGNYRVLYIIWNRRIWSAQRASEGWRYYSGWSPHTDHVHVSFKG